MSNRAYPKRNTTGTKSCPPRDLRGGMGTGHGSAQRARRRRLCEPIDLLTAEGNADGVSILEMLRDGVAEGANPSPPVPHLRRSRRQRRDDRRQASSDLRPTQDRSGGPSRHPGRAAAAATQPAAGNPTGRPLDRHRPRCHPPGPRTRNTPSGALTHARSLRTHPRDRHDRNVAHTGRPRNGIRIAAAAYSRAHAQAARSTSPLIDGDTVLCPSGYPWERTGSLWIAPGHSQGLCLTDAAIAEWWRRSAHPASGSP